LPEKISESNSYVSFLEEKHKSGLAAFKSTKKEMNEFLVQDALEYQRLSLGITYLLFDRNSKLISYLTLGMGALKLPDKAEFELHGKKLKEYPKQFPNQFPALLIGKLATDEKDEGSGGGSLLVDFAIKQALELRPRIGCAYVLAHVYPEKVGWYRKKGFGTHVRDFAGLETIPMYFELPLK